MHIDPNKNQINDNYDKALTASWASYWLINYYYNIEKKGKRTMLIYNILESKGFAYVGKKELDLRIRAGEGESDYLTSF